MNKTEFLIEIKKHVEMYRQENWEPLPYYFHGERSKLPVKIGDFATLPMGTTAVLMHTLFNNLQNVNIVFGAVILSSVIVLVDGKINESEIKKANDDIYNSLPAGINLRVFECDFDLKTLNEHQLQLEVSKKELT